jgi:translation initiation factor 1
MMTNIVFANELSELALLSDAPTISAYNTTNSTTGKKSKQKESDNKIHIRTQARSGRKCMTTIQGLHADLDLNRVAKALKKSLECGGSVVTDADFGDIVLLSGNQGEKVLSYFVSQGICRKDQIVIH